MGEDSESGKNWSELMESLRELPWSCSSRKSSVSLHPWRAPRTYFGPTRQLCEWRLEEEGGHNEVDFRNLNVVGQKVIQDSESGKQAGALVGLRRVALQVIYGSEEAHNVTENNYNCFWPWWGLAHEGIPCHPLPPETPERNTRCHTGASKMHNKEPFPIPDKRTHQNV